jgi:hypothetical protein
MRAGVLLILLVIGQECVDVACKKTITVTVNGKPQIVTVVQPPPMSKRDAKLTALAIVVGVTLASFAALTGLAWHYQGSLSGSIFSEHPLEWTLVSFACLMSLPMVALRAVRPLHPGLWGFDKVGVAAFDEDVAKKHGIKTTGIHSFKKDEKSHWFSGLAMALARGLPALIVFLLRMYVPFVKNKEVGWLRAEVMLMILRDSLSAFFIVCLMAIHKDYSIATSVEMKKANPLMTLLRSIPVLAIENMVVISLVAAALLITNNGEWPGGSRDAWSDVIAGFLTMGMGMFMRINFQHNPSPAGKVYMYMLLVSVATAVYFALRGYPRLTESLYTYCEEQWRDHPPDTACATFKTEESVLRCRWYCYNDEFSTLTQNVTDTCNVVDNCFGTSDRSALETKFWGLTLSPAVVSAAVSLWYGYKTHT